MSCSITTFLIASLLGFGPIPAAMANGELFSEIAVETVFDAKQEAATDTPEAEEAETTPKTPEIARVAGAKPLAKLLTEAGLNAESIDGATVTAQVSYRGIQRIATLKVAVDRDLIEITMPLRQLPEGETIDMATMMKLMQADSDLPAASFGYQEASRTVEIRYSVGNRSLSSGRLLSVLQSLIELVERRQPAVEINPTPSDGKSTLDRIGLANQPVETNLPVGTWVAKRGTKEAFALEILQNGSFKLVHIKSNRSSTSTGTASLTGDQLALRGNAGTTLQATMLSQTLDSFRIELAGRRIAFKSAK